MADHYVIDALAKFPKHWRDRISLVTVMTGPVNGWLMVRRPKAVPFCLRVSDLCNATRTPPHGPFELVETKRARAAGIEVIEVKR